MTELRQSVKRNPKMFWSYVKSLTGNSSMPNVIKWDQCEAFDAGSQANLFTDYFKFVYGPHLGQHGFIPGKSTCTQMVHFIQDISAALDKGCRTDVVYINLCKVFDSVPHSLLLNKMQYKYGFNSKLLQWFKSYLNARKQRVY